MLYKYFVFAVINDNSNIVKSGPSYVKYNLLNIWNMEHRINCKDN